jgi:chromosomal replication initiator protein
MMTDEEILALHDAIVPSRPVRARRVVDTPLAVPMGRIADTVARMAHLGNRGALLSARRDQHTAFARQLAMYLCRAVTRASFPVIGRFFGRDHSTVMHACKMVEARMASRPEFADKVTALVRDLKKLAGPFWEAAA